MTTATLRDEDPINIKDDDSDAEDALNLGKKAKTFAEKREDEKVRWSDSDYDDSDSEWESDSDDDLEGARGLGKAVANTTAGRK